MNSYPHFQGQNLELWEIIKMLSSQLNNKGKNGLEAASDQSLYT
jgi:hypothetical protein